MSSEVKALGEICKIKQGKYLSPSEMAEVATPGKSIPVVGGNGILGYTDRPSHTTDVALITCRGSKCGLIQWVPAPVWVSNNAMACDTGTLLGNRFLRYLFGSTDFEDVITGSAQPQITIGHLSKKEFSVCSESEWPSIVGMLGTLDDRINLLRETNKTLEAIAQALFKSWFVDFDPVRAKMEGRQPEGMDEATAALFPDSFEESELGLVPQGWRVGRIGDITAVIDCLHSKKPELIDSKYPFLQLSNIRDDGLLDTSEVAGVSESDYIKWTSRIEVTSGDCVITNVGRVGAVAQIPEGFKAAMGRNMTAIRLSSEWAYPTYLIELLQSPWMQTEIDAKTDVGTILNALNVKSIPLLRCVLASHSVMSAFEDVGRPVRKAMEQNIYRVQTLASIRDTLLPRLISGQLRLPDAEAEIEAHTA